MKATEQYFPVVLFIMLYKVILTFESEDEILKCDHISNESYWAVLCFGTVYFAVQGGSNFWVCGWNPQVWPFKWKLLSSNFLWCCLLCCKFSLWMKSYGVTIQMKPLWYYVHVELSCGVCEQQWFSTFLGETLSLSQTFLFKSVDEKASSMKGTSPMIHYTLSGFIISLPGNIWKEWKLHTQHYRKNLTAAQLAEEQCLGSGGWGE